VEVQYDHCAGLDVHKKSVVACVLHSAGGGVSRKQTRSFSTMLPELEKLRDWLVAEGCTHAVMEATGVYWKPVYNVLESQLTLMVVNPEHVKVISGRKTDVKDAEWLADLLRHGLLRASFIPDRDQRELREIVRFRTALVQDRVRAINRLQKSLEGANIKLASVLSDVMGVSGQRFLDALLGGEEDPEVLVELSHVRLRPKYEALKQALMGRLTPRLRFVVAQELAQIRSLDDQIAACDEAVKEEMRPFDPEIEMLDEIPGLARRGAENILAEIGVDLSRWPTAAHFASWCGVCPGNKASGGKRRPAKTRKGNPWLKRAATEAAWSAARTKQSYLGERYRSLAGRKGEKRALVALAHEILITIYYMLTRGRRYQDLGVKYIEERNRKAIERQALGQLQRLGYNVSLTPQAAA
jgi:transposase